MLKTSAGILILHKRKALLAHSTNSPWWRSYTPPKGGLEKDETPAEAASREVFEEVGILIDHNKLKEKVEVEYRDPRGKLYKIVHLFIHRIESYEEVGLSDDHVPFSQLQREEIDEAKFMSIEEVEKKILPRYLDYILPFLK
jgi:ADP-ribose pyrophosphatase YjhB (NUDIX family)